MLLLNYWPTYLNEVLNCEDFTVIDSRWNIFRNLYLAGQCFLRVLFERVSNQLARLVVLEFAGGVGTVLNFLLQAEFDFCFFR